MADADDPAAADGLNHLATASATIFPIRPLPPCRRTGFALPWSVAVALEPPTKKQRAAKPRGGGVKRLVVRRRNLASNQSRAALASSSSQGAPPPPPPTAIDDDDHTTVHDGASDNGKDELFDVYVHFNLFDQELCLR